MIFEGIDSEIEFIDLSDRNMGMRKIIEIIQDSAIDQVIRQINFNSNISIEEVDYEENYLLFLKKLKLLLRKHPTLIALNLANNYLFRFHPHPSNNHSQLYEKVWSDLLVSSRIIHIDLSNNFLTGQTGRELQGMIYLLKNYVFHIKSFICQYNNITSQSLKCFSHCLGINSKLTFLDLSNNLISMGSNGLEDLEGVEVLAKSMIPSSLKILKLSNNQLNDKNIQVLGQSIQMMPQFQDLDISNNNCGIYGCRSLKLALLSHSAHLDPTMGFRELDLSYNPIGDVGVFEICIGMIQSPTLRYLRLKGCGITHVGAVQIYQSLVENHTLVDINLEENDISEELIEYITAEISANEQLILITSDPLNINANNYQQQVYFAVARKLNHLPKDVLKLLHKNPTFIQPSTILHETLFQVCPPEQTELIQNMTHKGNLARRLEESRMKAKKLEASEVIYRHVLAWWKYKNGRKNIMQIVLELKKKLENNINPT